MNHFVSSRRNRSLEETANIASYAKRTKSEKGAKSAYADVTKNDLIMGLVNGNVKNDLIVGEMWRDIEGKLTLMVIVAYLSGLPPTFNSSLVIRGCRVIKCDILASKYCLMKCIAKVNTAHLAAGKNPWTLRTHI